MNKRLAILVRRRQELVIEILAQRNDISEIALQWQGPLALVDKGMQAVRFIRNHPGMMSGGLAALLSLRGIGMGGLVLKGWRLLYLYPSILFFGLNHLFSTTRSTSAEELLDGHPEEHMTEIDDQYIRKA